MADLTTLKTSGINADGLQLRVLDGKSYLVGPVIMAKETVMNNLLYPADELKRCTPGWNGRPVTVGHPKRDGNYVSANTPDVLEEVQAGFIFDTHTKDSDTKQVAEVWLELNKLDKFPAIRDAISAGAMLEVSTGLYLDKVEESGTFNGKEYSGKAINHLPDHLALLPNETGAFSIADGAGFPRINVMFGTNEITTYERSRLLRNALAAQLGPDRWFYVVDVFDTVFVVAESDTLTAYDYTFNKETGALTIGNGVEVFQKIEYLPINKLGDDMSVNKEPIKVKDPVVAEPVANTTVTEPVVEVNAETQEALALLAEVKAECVATIIGNKENKFTEDELNGMSVNQLKKIVAIASTPQATADMSGVGGPGGINAAGSNVKETPYIG